ncbi:subtilisin sub8 [Cystoisospora suis]|uniref:subtilisin n=1 Tax=Cystoisospora suis TaxID=483139 RepID=A0A2C6LHZ2_9APIC|nr:subtilisin sub8 [Cystoisospora suis]
MLRVWSTDSQCDFPLVPEETKQRRSLPLAMGSQSAARRRAHRRRPRIGSAADNKETGRQVNSVSSAARIFATGRALLSRIPGNARCNEAQNFSKAQGTWKNATCTSVEFRLVRRSTEVPIAASAHQPMPGRLENSTLSLPGEDHAHRSAQELPRVPVVPRRTRQASTSVLLLVKLLAVVSIVSMLWEATLLTRPGVSQPSVHTSAPLIFSSAAFLAEIPHTAFPPAQALGPGPHFSEHGARVEAVPPAPGHSIDSATDGHIKVERHSPLEGTRSGTALRVTPAQQHALRPPSVSVGSYVLDTGAASGAASRLVGASPLTGPKAGQDDPTPVWDVHVDHDGWLLVEDLRLSKIGFDVVIKQGEQVALPFLLSANDRAKVVLRATTDFESSSKALEHAADLIFMNEVEARQNQASQQRSSHTSGCGSGDEPCHADSRSDFHYETSRAPFPSLHTQAERDIQGADGVRRLESGSPMKGTRTIGLAHYGSSTPGMLGSVGSDERRTATRARRRPDLAARVNLVQRAIASPDAAGVMHVDTAASRPAALSLNSRFSHEQSGLSVSNSQFRHPSSPSTFKLASSDETPSAAAGSGQAQSVVADTRHITEPLVTPTDIVSSEPWEGWRQTIQLMAAETRRMDWSSAQRMLQSVRLQVGAAVASDWATSAKEDNDVSSGGSRIGGGRRAGDARNLGQSPRGRGHVGSGHLAGQTAGASTEAGAQRAVLRKTAASEREHDSAFVRKEATKEQQERGNRTSPIEKLHSLTGKTDAAFDYSDWGLVEQQDGLREQATSSPTTASEVASTLSSTDDVHSTERETVVAGSLSDFDDTTRDGTPSGAAGKLRATGASPQTLKSDEDIASRRQMVVVNIDALGSPVDKTSGRPLFYNDRILVGWRCTPHELREIKAMELEEDELPTGEAADGMTPSVTRAGTEANTDDRKSTYGSKLTKHCPRVSGDLRSADKTEENACGYVPPEVALDVGTSEPLDDRSQATESFDPSTPLPISSFMERLKSPKQTEERRRATDVSEEMASLPHTGDTYHADTPPRRLRVLERMLKTYAAPQVESVKTLFRRRPNARALRRTGSIHSPKQGPNNPPGVTVHFDRPANASSTYSNAPGQESTANDGSAPLHGGTTRGSVRLAGEEALGGLEVKPNADGLSPSSTEDMSERPQAREDGGRKTDFSAQGSKGEPSLLDDDELCGMDLIKLTLGSNYARGTDNRGAGGVDANDLTALKAFIREFASNDYVGDILFIVPDAPIHAANLPDLEHEEVVPPPEVSEKAAKTASTKFDNPSEASGLSAFDDSLLDVQKSSSEPVSRQLSQEQLLPAESTLELDDRRTTKSRGLQEISYNHGKISVPEAVPNDPLFNLQWALGPPRHDSQGDANFCFRQALEELQGKVPENSANSSRPVPQYQTPSNSQLAKVRQLCEAVGRRNAVEPSSPRDRIRSTGLSDEDGSVYEDDDNTLNRDDERNASSQRLGSPSDPHAPKRKDHTSGQDKEADEASRKVHQLQERDMGRRRGGSDIPDESTFSSSNIDMVQAWRLKLNGGVEDSDSRPTVLVAVIDTGVNYLHSDLADSMWVNSQELHGIPGFDDDQNGYVDDVYGWNFLHGNNNPMDDNGHGSHVAGIIGAQRDNKMGVSGISNHARILALKILDKKGEGDVSHAIPAIRYALDNGAKVITNSWGGISGPGTQILGVLLKEAVADASGTVFVIAAGNDGMDITKDPYYPASFLRDWTITVAAHGRDGALPHWTNYGQRNVHLTAPGESITSTWIGSGYRLSSGTSMAAPMVSGVAAEILAYNPTLQPQQVVDVLVQSGVHDKRHKNLSLTGSRLNAYRAIVLSQLQFFSVSAGEVHIGGAEEPTAEVQVYFRAQSLPPGVYEGSLELVYARRAPNGTKNPGVLSGVFKRRVVQLVQVSLPVRLTVV